METIDSKILYHRAFCFSIAPNSHIDEVLYRLYNNMIPKQELRIGNSVMYDNRIFKISAITDEFPLLNTAEFGIGVVDWNNIHPIPITEEALVKMGAVSNPYQDRYELHGVNIECNKTRGTTELWIEFMPHVNSIHRLQNFIYSLKQTELSYEN